MSFGPKLGRAFFERPCAAVARDLIGCVLLRRLPGDVVLAGRIVETEAYLGDGSDPGSHSHRGPTRRNRAMFGPAGRLYAYRIYGIHTCVNVVCEPEGVGAAVLLRSVEPLLGQGEMRRRRQLAPDAHGPALASGPGRLAQAFGLALEHDGMSALGSALRVQRGEAGTVPLVVDSGPRVGLSKGADLPYRFHAQGSPWVSPWRPGGRRQRGAREPRANVSPARAR